MLVINCIYSKSILKLVYEISGVSFYKNENLDHPTSHDFFYTEENLFFRETASKTW